MSLNLISSLIKSAILCILLCLVATPVLTASESVYKLDNGMEVILKETHGSPMVASMVFVKSGSKYESEYENGLTHFLEHLLFDGTSTLNREELDKSVRDLGGYINAFTREEMTAYLVLLPKQYIDYGMTVQVDMLFNSLIPEEELPKERKVVIEEINRDIDSPNYASDKFFGEKAYANTPYNRPVLGYKAFIENISREAIVAYWKKYYRPENMTLLVIGDFESEAMKQQVASIFGTIPKSVDKIAEQDFFSEYNYSIEGETVSVTSADVKSTLINFSIDAPRFTDEDFYAFDLLTQYLGTKDVSPLMNDLLNGADAPATEAAIYLNNFEEFSRLNISITADSNANYDEIVATVNRHLKSASALTADEATLAGIKTSVKTSFIYNSEKLHYLGFILGRDLMVSGWDYVKSYPDKLAAVTWSDCQKAAVKYLDSPNFRATVVHPPVDGQDIYQPYEMTAEAVKAHFDTATFTEYSMEPNPALTYPTTDQVTFEMVDNAEYAREVLDNGLTVLIKSNPTTEVFALNVIGKNRSANEADNQAGITDFVNRCIEKGTTTRNALELSQDLSNIGANVTLYDNPWIPYDDRYTSRSFSFMKFETIDQFAPEGFKLFADMILNPSFDTTEVENVRRSMMGVIGRNTASPGKVARGAYYEHLFENNPMGKSIMGSARTIGSITADDLKAHHDKFYAPENMILSVASSRSIDEIKEWVNNSFGSVKNSGSVYLTPAQPEPILEIKNNHTELDKEQISIFLGSPVPGSNHDDAPILQTAASILSTRMYLNLREKQGLAYSVGTGIRFDKDFGWYYTTIGTGAENYQKALDGIKLQIDKLKLDGPTEAEINTAKNQLWGRLMSAKLSSINQAYYMGLNELLGHQPGYDKTYISMLDSINAESIRRVVATYFRTDAYILTSAGKMEL